MSRLVYAFLLLLTVFSPVFAQPTNFGEPFALTNTRYATAGGVPRLVSNGSEPFLFWATEGRIRVTKYVPGQARLGRAVLEDNALMPYAQFEVVWTGTHFLVATTELPAGKRILGRIVDRNGIPQGETFTIVDGVFPHLASNGTQTLLAYDSPAGVYVVLLGADGRPAGKPVHVMTGPWSLSLVATRNGFALLVPKGERGASLFRFDTAGRITSERGFPGQIPLATLATDGERLLALWQEYTFLIANVIDASNAVTHRLSLHEIVDGPDFARVNTLAAAWSGSEWTAAYNTTSANATAFHVVQLDANVSAELAHETRDAYVVQPSLLNLGGRVLAAWVPRGEATLPPVATPSAFAPIAITALPLANGHEVASYAPAQQTLLATATSNDALLVVWRESGDLRDALRAGVRKADGSWTEREIAPYARDNAVAGSDGREFVVITDGFTDSTIIRLDQNGAPIGSPLVVELLRAYDIAWNGRTYAIATSGPNVRTLTPSGTLSAATTVAPDYGLESAIATDGNDFYLAWTIGGTIMCTCPPYSIGLAGMALRSDLTPREAAPRRFVEDGGADWPAVVWDGQAYVVAWANYDEDSVLASRVSLLAGVPSTSHAIATGFATEVTATAVSGGTAILWKTYDDNRHHVRFLHRDGTLSPVIDLDRATGRGKLETLASDKLAYVHSSVEDGEPHHGTRRIMMRIGTTAPPLGAPDAPRLTGQSRGRRSFVLEWNEPSPNVNGYRVEYRVGDGQWNEFEGFLPREQRQYAYDTQNTRDVAFRVRAFNDGGAGAYSNVVTIPAPSRRRAVR
jgi:hypothetical protein